MGQTNSPVECWRFNCKDYDVDFSGLGFRARGFDLGLELHADCGFGVSGLSGLRW